MSIWVAILMLRYVTNISLVIFVSIYLKLAYYNVIVPKTLTIISWCHSALGSIFVSYFTSKLVSID